MIEKLFGVDLIKFGQAFGPAILSNLIFISIWQLISIFSAKRNLNRIEKIKDKEINRIVRERNKYQKIFLGKHMISTNK